MIERAVPTLIEPLVRNIFYIPPGAFLLLTADGELLITDDDELVIIGG